MHSSRPTLTSIQHVKLLCALQVDTFSMLVAIVYITQLFTRSLLEQQSSKWPLFGYIMAPLLVLQRGDPAWYDIT